MTPAKYEVNPLGAGFFAIGSWYWCRIDANGYPTEPISSHGPFFFKFLAVNDAEKATG
jgi:hypothetical protein